MTIKRTTIELDDDLTTAAKNVTGQTLRATVERGLRLVIDAASRDDAERSERIERYRASALNGVDLEVLLSEDAWR